jgi:hypothetical protein
MERVLRWFESESEYAGQYVTADPGKYIYPLVDAHNQEELTFLMNTLASNHLLDRSGSTDKYRLTTRGWDALHPARFGGVPGTCFVAMSFNDKLLPILTEGIIPAIEDDCHYQVVRVDQVPHNGDITERIIGQIRSAQFLVADFTGHRPNVYYEAGFAVGLGRQVVRTCHRDDAKEKHFDTRQFTHLEYSSPEELRSMLADHVKATIGVFERR